MFLVSFLFIHNIYAIIHRNKRTFCYLFFWKYVSVDHNHFNYKLGIQSM